MKLVFDRISALDAYAEWGRAGRDTETYCAVLPVLANCRFATSGNVTQPRISLRSSGLL
jgi:hypothetical protein